MEFKKIVIIIGIVFSSQNLISQTQKNNKMNLKELHKDDVGVQTNMMFSTTEGKVISLQILKGSELKEHISKVPALLVCIFGSAIYEDENGNKINVLPKDFIKIEPNVKHWVVALEDSNFLLIK